MILVTNYGCFEAAFPFLVKWAMEESLTDSRSVFFDGCIFRCTFRALKSLLGKPCLKLENGESKSLRDLCGRFFLAQEKIKLIMTPEISWSWSQKKVLAEWETHEGSMPHGLGFFKGNVYGTAIYWLWVRPVVLRILDFKKQQVDSSYSFSSVQFHRFHSLRGSFRRSIPDLDTNGHGHQGYWMMFWTRRSAWLRHFWPTSSDQSINRFGDGSQGRSCGTIGSFPPKHSESEWYVPAILHQHLLP